MSTTSDEIPHERVEVEQARDHARFALLRAWLWEVPGFAALGTAEPGGHWMVHDLDGRELFYLFELVVGDALERRRVGWVRVAASSIVGPPVLAVELGNSGWDPEVARIRAIGGARKKYPDVVEDTTLVCYSYPKIGVRVSLGSEGRRNAIFDASSLAEIPPPSPDGLEGFGAWSYYQTVVEPQLERRLHLWKQGNDELLTAQEKLGSLFDENPDSSVLREQWRRLVEASHGFAVAPVSHHILRFSRRCRTHDCFERYLQETDDYCAVATAQMILDFYRYYHAQDVIAETMGTIRTKGTILGGTPNAGQLAGYASLSNHALVASFDCCATWTEAKAELDANRPVKDGIPLHARALTGWMRCALLSARTSTLTLQIYDPAPSDPEICTTGGATWEEWDSVPHTNFIYVRHA
jgi:hypothetical protein